jgi:hypothetical protein
MKRNWILAGILLLYTIRIQAQELYVFTDPASNVPAKSLSAKISARLADNSINPGYSQRYMPELMAGLNKNWMLRVSTTFSDFYSQSLRWESVKTYVKWRFYAKDDLHRHFRMAVFADAAYSRNNVIYEEMNLDGDNSGIQAGLIGTQLINKLAISGTASLMQVFNKYSSMHSENFEQTALNYSLSAGYLLFPLEYTGYDQINLNLYFELLGSKGLEKGMYYVDAAPAIQLIFGSSTKLNLGARFQATGNISRIGQNNFYLSLERSFLGALQKDRKMNISPE